MKKIFFGKKGQSGVETVYSIIWFTFVRLIILSFYAALFVYIYTILFGSNINSYTLNSLVIENRVLYSPTGLAYTDSETGRVYPWVIDMEKATQEKFERAFSLGDLNKIAARIEIKTASGELLKELYINKDWYERWSPLENFDNYNSNIFKKPVLLKRENAFLPGILKIHVVSPNV